LVLLYVHLILLYINKRNQASQKEAQNRLDENEQLINELISEKEALKQKIELMSEQMEFSGIIFKFKN